MKLRFWKCGVVLVFCWSIFTRSEASVPACKLLPSDRWHTELTLTPVDTWVCLQGIEDGTEIQAVPLQHETIQPGFTLTVMQGEGLVERLSAVGATLHVDAPPLFRQAQRVILKLNRPLGSPPLSVRLFKNDVRLPGNRDRDGDGLGYELEKSIGTCDRKQQTIGTTELPLHCSDIADLRDTDGDGLRDDWEWQGKLDVHPPQTLPAWGANPTHKDIFLEVDFARETKVHNELQLVEKMSAEVARNYAAAFADSFNQDPELRRKNATLLQNPDGTPGIAVHFDLGWNPTDLQDQKLFGDWGGFNAINAIENADGSYRGIGGTEAWPQNLTPARRGVFHYAVGYIQGLGSQAWTFGLNFSQVHSDVAVHESGHGFGVSHGGPWMNREVIDVNCKPNYPSVMNYAYGRFSDGFSGGGLPEINNTRLIETGFVDPLRHSTFLKNLRERFQYTVDLTNGSVDWNRDGIFNEASQPVSAYANDRPGQSCEYTRVNRLEFPAIRNESHQPVGTPSLLRAWNHSWLFTRSREGRVFYRQGPKGWHCETPRDQGCGKKKWEASAKVVPGLEELQGMHAVAIPARLKGGGSHENDGVSIFVVGVNRASQIVGAWKDQGRDWRMIELQGSPSDALYQGEPHVVISEQGVLSVLLRTETGEVFAHELEGFQKFGRPIPLQVKVGSKWSALRVSSGSMVGVVSMPKDPLLLGQGGDLDTDSYGLRALAQTSEGIVFFSVTQTPERWELRREKVGSEPDGTVSRYWSLTGRPSLHWTLPRTLPWTHSASGQSGRGALQIYASTENNGGNPDSAPVLLRVRSVVDRLDASGSQSRWRIPHPSPLDNEWFYGAGVSALYDPTLDSEPRVAVVGFSGSHPRAEKKWSIQFRPHGGGLVDLTYRSANDWEALRVTPCELLQSTLDKKAVNCPKRKNDS